MLFEFIDANRDEIIHRCRSKVARRSIPLPTQAEINYGVPVFLDQLVDALKGRTSDSAEISATALQHGHSLLLRGFTVSQVVHDYGDVCQAITELAVEGDAPITADDFRTLNRCLDDAIASAVTEYGRARNAATVETEHARDNERLGFFVHELRNLTNTSMMALQVLRTGNVGIGGSTATVLHRSLLRTVALIDRSMAEVRLTQGVQNPEPLLVAALVNELTPTATLEADAKGLVLKVLPIEGNAAVNAVSERTRFGSLVGASVPMRMCFALLERAAARDVTVLLEGETGTECREAAAEARALVSYGFHRWSSFLGGDRDQAAERGASGPRWTRESNSCASARYPCAPGDSMS
jgi:hypothetical protein